MRTIVKENQEAASQYVAEQLISALKAALATSGTASLLLAGGSTYKRVYEILCLQYREALPWSQIHLFFTDERCVPLDHPWSNYGIVCWEWLYSFNGDGPVRHWIDGEIEPWLAAQEYEEELKEYATSRNDGKLFDFALLGMGADGHTASIFPQNMDEVLKSEKWVLAVEDYQEPRVRRITLTFAPLQKCQAGLILLNTSEKVKLFESFSSEEKKYPVQGLDMDALEWVLVK